MPRNRRFRAELRVDVVGDLATLVVEDVADNDLRAFAHEEAGFGSALPSRTAGNQSNLAFESIHAICLMVFFDVLSRR